MIDPEDPDENKRDALLEALHADKVIVYPTDTIYGLGCDATDDDAVQRVYAIKGRGAKPVSVIAPSLDWIRAHCIIPSYAEAWVAKLPGPYTLLFALRDTTCIAPSVLQGRTALGVRIPMHWCSEATAVFGKPMVTTSANPSGHDVVRSVTPRPSWLPEDIVVIDEGTLGGTPSTVVDCTGDEAKILR